MMQFSGLPCGMVINVGVLMVCFLMVGTGRGKQIRHGHGQSRTEQSRSVQSRSTRQVVDPMKTYYLGFLPTVSGSRGLQKYHVGAFIHAIHKMNNRSDMIEQRIRLDYKYNDTKMDTLVAIRDMTELYNRDVAAFIGLEEMCATEARVAAAWNIPMITYVSFNF